MRSYFFHFISIMKHVRWNGGLKAFMCLRCIFKAFGVILWQFKVVQMNQGGILTTKTIIVPPGVILGARACPLNVKAWVYKMCPANWRRMTMHNGHHVHCISIPGELKITFNCKLRAKVSSKIAFQPDSHTTIISGTRCLSNKSYTTMHHNFNT
jgi:hypothetical protein